ncbi:SusC/RagA family TonB-linked outer membrane protein [Hufsiella ginkgonis]|uniref:SusC/RagA family TonB-linked outer membrane protein n=1 Tax=Hufsiella ginkgonis TaxID=2695274 RepID=A0A7K1XU02_9SPHI|nr:SusC/RagA family TonB-linked outer membrane protein [Hufsiella ginkgonis]MXV13986.1 SusC/RagA family TonB-linked outer membrane protein [Hufsiella ginkgonis]
MRRKLLAMVLWMCATCAQLMAQSQTVTGTVTDKADGSTLPGVSVLVKGSKTGTQTGVNGQFAIQVPAGAQFLVFSYIGYTAQTVRVSGNTLNVSLEVDAKQLSEVVVTGFGTQRDRKTLGYSATSISAEDLTQAKVTNVSNALAAKIPGARVAGSGGAFTGSSVIIRGFTTFTGSNQPLYVVDGIPVDNSGGGASLQSGASVSNRIVDVNPEDIENLTVLKGAAATALYGSRGASGVILITTKKAKAGQKSKIEFSTSYNAIDINKLPDYQNTYGQGVAGAYSATVNTSWGPEMKGQTVNNYLGQPVTYQAYPDNVKDLFKTGYNLQNNLSFSGASDKSTYRVAYGNGTETYVIDGNKLKRNNLTVNASTQLNSKLKVGTAFTYTNNTSIRTQQGNQLANPVFRAFFTPRSFDLMGTPFEDAAGVQTYFGAEDNPLWSIKHIKYNDEINRVFGNVNLRYDFNNWLNAEFKIGTDYYNTKVKGFDELGNRGGGNAGSASVGIGGVVERNSNLKNVNSTFTVTGNKRYGDFGVTATLGNEVYDNYSTNANVTGLGLVVRGFDNIKNTLTYNPGFGSSRVRLVGFFADVAADYKNFITLNVKARNDYSSTLTKENRSIFYPAFATSFILTEAFPEIKESGKINLVKLKANWGEVGKGAPAYSTDSYYITASAGDGFTTGITFPFNGLAGYTLSNTAGNNAITPEFTREWEVGTELGFFNNRITADMALYRRKTRSVILNVPLAASSGVGSVTKNAGSLSTKGFEASLGITPVKVKDFLWNAVGNFTKFKSIVQELAPGVPVITLGGFTTPNVRLVAGQEYNQIYGSKMQRDANGKLLLTAAGLPLATSGVEILGNANPDWTMGITNTFTYKSLSLDVLLDIRKGGDMYSRNIADVIRNGAAKETAEVARFNADGTVAKPYMFEGVYAPGTPNAGQPNTTMITSEQYWGNSGKFVAAEGYMYDTSWFRVREANISYRVPVSLASKTPFGSIDVGLFGRNLFMHAPNFPHFDPEQNVLGISNAQGLEFNAQPSTRTIGFNVRLTL